MKVFFIKIIWAQGPAKVISPLVDCFSIYFIYLGFYVAFNTVQVIPQWVVGRAEETSAYSSSGFCTVNC